MDELITFVRQQLDEDERVARRTSMPKEPLSWHYDRDHFTVRADDPDEYPIAAYRDKGESSLLDVYGEHIARWDPARVLAEVEAKRRILDLHAPFVDHAGRVRCEHCSDLCHSRSGLGCDDPADAMYPCETVSLLAQPYAGRPGWHEEWRA